MCESGGDTYALSPYGDAGLFQISDVHRWTREQRFDPNINVRAAYELWLGRGDAHWPNCG